MTLQVDSWAASGAQSSARTARLQLQSASRSGNGVVEATDMEVRELAVPGSSVRATAGAAVALGQEMAFQGSYYAFNVGEADVPITPTGSGAGRSDLVILRVEDPNISGTSWNHDVATDPIYYFRVLQGVDPSTTTVPAGTTGVALARIDIPASTATITQDMITDVREMVSPRTETVLLMQRGSDDPDLGGNIRDYFENWPDLVWQVRIPEWATEVQLEGEWINCGFFPADQVNTGGSADARGNVRVAIGFGAGGGPTDLQTPMSPYNFNQFSPTNGYRVIIGAGGTLSVPASMRGELANVRLQCRGEGTDGSPGTGPEGRLRADAGSVFKARITFNEVPAPTLA